MTRYTSEHNSKNPIDPEQNRIYWKIRNFKETYKPDIGIFKNGGKFTGIKSEIEGKTFSKERWKAKCWDLDSKDYSSAIIFEVGGPTGSNFMLLNFMEPLEKMGEVVITNLNYEQGVDALVDGQNIPIGNNNVNVVLAGGLPIGIRRRTLQEAKRILKPCGVIVWETCTREDLDSAYDLGLKILEYDRVDYFNRAVRLDVIFRKPF